MLRPSDKKEKKKIRILAERFLPVFIAKIFVVESKNQIITSGEKGEKKE